MNEIKVAVNEYPIRLGQFLKLADHVQDGNEAKIMIASGSVTVNGQVDFRRGRKLKGGDVVEVGNERYLCS